MKVNGEAIYATQASPFASLPWGRCTRKESARGTTLYLHVFDWPASGTLRVPGLFNTVRSAYLLADGSRKPLMTSRQEDAVTVRLPSGAPDSINTVIVLDLDGKADVSAPPAIDTTLSIFIDQMAVPVSTERENLELHYTIDGSTPTASSPKVRGPVTITSTAMLRARAFRGGKPVSDIREAKFTKVTPVASVSAEVQPGLHYRYYEGDWDQLPDFARLTPRTVGKLTGISLELKRERERYGIVFSGYLRVPADGVYRFSLSSDDGSRLFLGEQRLIDNDGLHGMQKRNGVVALEGGLHPIRIEYFNKTGGEGLTLSWSGPGFTEQTLPASALSSGR